MTMQRAPPGQADVLDGVAANAIAGGRALCVRWCQRIRRQRLLLPIATALGCLSQAPCKGTAAALFGQEIYQIAAGMVRFASGPQSSDYTVSPNIQRNADGLHTQRNTTCCCDHQCGPRDEMQLIQAARGNIPH